jgi:hypothetical protein
VTPLVGPRYDYGGNHRDDSFDLDYAGIHYVYGHSSLGYNWRPCQPMDCLQSYRSDGTTLTLIENGCTKDRTLPIVCVSIGADGTARQLVDEFSPCS